MTTSRRLLALASTVAVAGLVASTAAVPASARTTDDLCLQRGPIPVRALAAVARAGCSVVGRMVTDGRVSVMVPPAGTSVAGDGVGRHGDVHGLTVTNTGATVRAVSEPAGAASARRGSPAACKDPTFNLEGHKWRSGLRYRVNLAKMPKRLHASTVVHQIKVANHNMRTGRNSCHKPRLQSPASHYLGRTKAKPNVNPAGGPSCGARNPRTSSPSATSPGACSAGRATGGAPEAR